MKVVFAFCLAFAVLANPSVFVIPSSHAQTLLGEIVVSGRGENGQLPSIKVNGERALTGRTFPSYSLIETPAAASADIVLGTLGRIGLSADSSLIVSFGEKSISGKLLTGKIKVFNAEGVSVRIETPDNVLSNNSKLLGGFTIDVQSGKTMAAAETGELFNRTGEPVGRTQTAATGGRGLWIPVVVVSAIVAAAVAYVIFNQSDDEDVPGFVASPVR